MKKIKNIAIIAHVDHGKTTLVDQLLKSSETTIKSNENSTRLMDSNDIERERGITILAKTTGIKYKDYLINILDTPGHCDFGGEVERIMNMVDGVLLLVDAFEGVMPQTRFVLKKALEHNVKPIVILNKVDRPNINIKGTLDKILELFLELNAREDFLDFKVAYTSGLKGTSSLDPDISTQKPGMQPILDLIINETPNPSVSEGPFQFQASLLDYNDFVGRIGIGLIKRGKIHVGDMVTAMRLDGSTKQFKILKLFGYFGLKRTEIEEAEAGEIVAISGLPDINVGETICDPSNLEALPFIKIDEPTLEMTFGVNSSPFSGKDGKLVTARVLEERLFKEMQKDVSLKVSRILGREEWKVLGRGELHLGVLIENMRREGYELEVSKPKVVIKEIDGVECEPYEDCVIEVPLENEGTIIETLGLREGEMVSLEEGQTMAKLTYVIPSRGLLGFVNNFLSMTKGYGTLSHIFKEYRPKVKKEVGERLMGVLVSTASGKSTPYAIEHVEEHGTMFIKPGEEVYEGMIVGEHRYTNDLAVSVTLEKHQTNTRSAGKDNTVVLKATRNLSLEACLDYINSDELVEVTPNHFRMRKKILNTAERKKFEAHQKSLEKNS